MLALAGKHGRLGVYLNINSFTTAHQRHTTRQIYTRLRNLILQIESNLIWTPELQLAKTQEVYREHPTMLNTSSSVILAKNH